MKFLLSSIGSRGDVQPLVALALELRALSAGGSAAIFAPAEGCHAPLVIDVLSAWGWR